MSNTPYKIVYCYPVYKTTPGIDQYGNLTSSNYDDVDWSNGDFAIQEKSVSVKNGKPYVLFDLYKEKLDRVQELETLLHKNNIVFI